MYTVEEIRENYKRFSDSKIESLALYESKRLRKEVLGILKEEIEKRNLDKSLINWVDTESKTFEGIELDTLREKIQSLNCPKCNERGDRLYGFEINQVVSVLIYAIDTRYEKVLCLSCGKKEKLRAILITFFAGWWSKHGFFLTPWIVIKGACNYFFIDKISDKVINRLIEENTGYFRRNGTKINTLNQLIKRGNKIDLLDS